MLSAKDSRKNKLVNWEELSAVIAEVLTTSTAQVIRARALSPKP